MQSIQDPERRQYNPNPKWEVPLEVCNQYLQIVSDPSATLAMDISGSVHMSEPMTSLSSFHAAGGRVAACICSEGTSSHQNRSFVMAL